MSAHGGPNILFIVLDTVRKDHLTPYGYNRQTTPVLDSFAEEALRCEEAVSQAPWTLPVHASLFTGTYPSVHGASQQRPFLNADTETLASVLASLGYATACYSSNAWITPYTRLTYGFEEQDNFFEALPGTVFSKVIATGWQRMNENSHLRYLANRIIDIGNEVHEYFAFKDTASSKTPAIVNQICDFIDGKSQWFVFANFMDAHLPYNPPQTVRDEFSPGVDPKDVCQNAKAFNAGTYTIDSDEWQAIQGLYDGAIRHMDTELGRLFDHLRASEAWEDTICIVCSDHGELHGEHNLFGHEFAVYDPLVNVPLMIKHPALDHGSTRQPVELLDLYHTILHSVDAVSEADSIGATPVEANRSLISDTYREFDLGETCFVEYSQPVIELQQLERKAESEDITLEQNSRFYSQMRAARQPSRKYIRQDRIPDEGYDLKGDPIEMNTVDPSQPPISELVDSLNQFESRYNVVWNKNIPPNSAGIDDMNETTKDRLRDLGYL